MQKTDDKVGNKTVNKEERQRKKRERERKIEKDLTKNNNWLVHMREKQKSFFKNYVLLLGKDFFLFSFFSFFLSFFLHKHYYIGAKLILAILMLISRKPVQIGGTGEKCVFFVLLRTGHRKRVRLPNVGSCCVSLHVAFR